MKTLSASLRLLVVLTALTGLLYPALVWLIAQIAFPTSANGSLVHHEGRIVGSALLSQKTADPGLFWPRPSATDFATLLSGASNLSWSSRALIDRLSQAERAEGMASCSGSGLDPHLSLTAVRAQLARVSERRGWNEAKRARLEAWIATHSEGGTLSPAYVNILLLNLVLPEIDRTP